MRGKATGLLRLRSGQVPTRHYKETTKTNLPSGATVPRSEDRAAKRARYIVPLREEAAPTAASAKILLDKRLDLALLEAVAIGIEGELDGKHESEYEESQEDGLVELRAPNAGDYSYDHDERANAGERAEKKDACGATEIGGRNDAKRDIGQNERSVGKKDKEHASCGFHQVRAK